MSAATNVAERWNVKEAKSVFEISPLDHHG